MHLRRTLDDFHDLGATIIARHRGGFMAAGSAPDLDRIQGGTNGSSRGEIFGNESLCEGFGKMFVLGSAGAPAEKFGGLQVGTHLRNERLDHSQVANPGFANPPRGGVAGAFLEAAAEKTQSRTGSTDPPKLETDRGHMRQTESRFPDHVGRGYFHIVETESRQTGGAKSHQILDGFDFKPDAISGHETSQGFLIQLPKHQKHSGELAAGNPFLFTA